MKLRSDNGRGLTHVCVGIICAAMVIFLPSALCAQSRTWSITGSAGVSVLNFGAVDDDNAADARGWARLGFPVSQFPSVKQALLYSARLSYRHDREFTVSLLALYSTKSVRASYHSSDGDLDLSRGIGSTDVILCLAYYPAARPYFLEWYLQATVGLTVAHATATATGTQYVKVAGVPTPVPLIDTDARFSKTRTSVGAGVGADIPVMARVAIKTEASYRFAQFGAMGGTVTRFGEQRDETTTIEFNYSGFLISAGIRFEL